MYIGLPELAAAVVAAASAAVESATPVGSAPPAYAVLSTLVTAPEAVSARTELFMSPGGSADPTVRVGGSVNGLNGMDSASLANLHRAASRRSDRRRQTCPGRCWCR